MACTHKPTWQTPTISEVGRRTIVAMRSWLGDCSWGEDYTFEDFQDMGATRIARGVSRSFDGGVIAFVETL